MSEEQGQSLRTPGEELASIDRSFRRARLRHHLRFVFEAGLLQSFLFLVYIWILYSQGSWREVYGPGGGYLGRFLYYLYFFQGARLALLWAISSIFLLFVYYGTSFEVTPLRLLLRPLRVIVSSTRKETLGHSEDLSELSQSTETLRRRDELSRAQERRPLNISSVSDLPSASWRATELEAETVTAVLASSAHDAAKLADKMERRINTHLILGVLVGLVGLLIWYYSFFIGGTGADKTHSWTEMIPRISILLFIELLAGFFLQQYRIGVEDLKYFLELERRANANRIAYAIFDKLNDAEAKRQFAKSLMELPSDTRLKIGETTTSLEALKGQENVMLKALSILGEQLESMAKLAHKDK